MTKEELSGMISVLKGVYATVKNDFSFAGFLLLNRLGGLFYKRAEMLKIKFLPKLEKLLRDTFEAQKRRVEFMRGEIGTISDALIKSSADCAFLKGSALTNLKFGGRYLYSDGERVSNDIDILAKPDGIKKIGDILSGLGYVQGRYDRAQNAIEPFTRTEILKRRMTRGEVAPYVKPTGNAVCPFFEVDINFSLGNTPHENTELLYEMVDSASVYDGKLRLKTMPAEYFFLHLLFHHYKEGDLYFPIARQKDTDLYKLADIYYFIKSGALDWAKIDNIVSKHSLESKVGAVLAQVREIFHDKELTELTKKYDGAQPLVIDYDTMRRYRWRGGYLERVLNGDPLSLLEEIQYDSDEK